MSTMWVKKVLVHCEENKENQSFSDNGNKNCHYLLSPIIKTIIKYLVHRWIISLVGDGVTALSSLHCNQESNQPNAFIYKNILNPDH